MKAAAVAAALALAGCGDATRAPVARPAARAEKPRVADLGAYCREVEAPDRRSKIVDPGAEPRQPVILRPAPAGPVTLTGTWAWSDDEDPPRPQSAQLNVEVAAGEPTLVLSLGQREQRAIGRYRIGRGGALALDGRWEGRHTKGGPWVQSTIDTLAFDGVGMVDESPPRPIFPDQPIGIGARWTVVTTAARVRSISAYELVERTGDRLRVKLRRIGCARHVPFHGPGLDGGWVECESIPDDPRCWIGTELSESLAEGELAIDLAAPLPRGSVSVHQRWRWREPGWDPFRSIATEREQRYHVTLR